MYLTHSASSPVNHTSSPWFIASQGFVVLRHTCIVVLVDHKGPVRLMAMLVIGDRWRSEYRVILDQHSSNVSTEENLTGHCFIIKVGQVECNLHPWDFNSGHPSSELPQRLLVRIL